MKSVFERSGSDGGGFQWYVGRLECFSSLPHLFVKISRGDSQKLSLNTGFRSAFLSDSFPGKAKGGSVKLNWNRDKWNSLKLHLYWSHTVIKKNLLNQKGEGFFYFYPARLLLLFSSIWHRHQLCHPSQKSQDRIISVLVWPISWSWRSWQPALDRGPLAGRKMLCLIMCWLAAVEPDCRSFFAAIWTSTLFTLISVCLTNLTQCLTSSVPVKHADWLNDKRVTDLCTWQTVLDWQKPTFLSLWCFWRLNSKGRQQTGKLSIVVTDVDAKVTLMGFSKRRATFWC